MEKQNTITGGLEPVKRKSKIPLGRNSDSL